MKLGSNIEQWADAHHPKWLDILRVFLGLVLVAKGISFIGNTELIANMLRDSSVEFLSIAIAHYVIVAHITRRDTNCDRVDHPRRRSVSDTHFIGCDFFCKCFQGVFCNKFRSAIFRSCADVAFFLFDLRIRSMVSR